MRSCSNRVIELNLKMLILTRFVPKNDLLCDVDHIPRVSLEEFNI
jgi:hypothetical protein